ncbi:MAG: sigma-70 family RNA polymerase sigma factor [Bacteroidales bacterium]|nr:sigma-70 family RNA polymerase sigma factor [Bacteroidales bacterium]
MRERNKAYFDSLSDRELVDLLLANDEEAIEYLFFMRCNGMFAHIACSVFQSQTCKEELITDFYFFLSENNWNRLRKFEFKAGLNTWLTVIALRFFKKMRISQTKLVAIDPQLIAETQKEKTDDYDVIDEMSRLELYKAIDRLSKPRERYALLADLTGKRAEDIAAEMGCTVAAVYNLTKKARLELKSIMQERKEV